LQRFCAEYGPILKAVLLKSTPLSPERNAAGMSACKVSVHRIAEIRELRRELCRELG
jgi:hypothetical protein